MLSPFAKISITEVEPYHTSPTVPVEKALEKEGERIIKGIKGDPFVIALERTGTALSSEKFATLLSKETETGRSVAFIIGGAHGLSDDVLRRSNKKISLSEMTFTHEMARVLLIEQLYRAETILRGKQYHY